MSMDYVSKRTQIIDFGDMVFQIQDRVFLRSPKRRRHAPQRVKKLDIQSYQIRIDIKSFQIRICIKSYQIRIDTKS